MDKEDLEFDISVALGRWDERSTFTIGGVKNLTRSDIDILIICCEYFDAYGSLLGLKYFSPEVKEVLKHYGML